MFEEFENDIETKDVAITLKKLVPLFDVVNAKIKDLAQSVEPIEKITGSKSWVKYQYRIYMKVSKKSVKRILKKNPINIEMPTLVAVGNGQIKKVHDGQKVNEVDEIECHQYEPEQIGFKTKTLSRNKR